MNSKIPSIPFLITIVVILFSMIGCTMTENADESIMQNQQNVENQEQIKEEQGEKNTSIIEVEKEIEEQIEVKPQQGFKAPDFTFINQEGKEVSLYDLNGKPVFLVFWASWCPHCKKELPSVQELYEKYGEDIHFLAINVRDEKGKGEAIMQDNQYTFPVIFDENSSIMNLFRIQPIPINFFIDQNGIIRWKVLGKLPQTDLEGYLQELME